MLYICIEFHVYTVPKHPSDPEITPDGQTLAEGAASWVCIDLSVLNYTLKTALRAGWAVTN